MDLFGTIRKVFITTEQDVLAFVGRVWNEEKIAASEIASVFKWVTGKGLPALQSDIAAIMPFVAILGDISGHPELKVEMAALNTAMAGVNAFATAANSGVLSADAVVQGYGSLKQASAAAQRVVATAATVVAVTPASNAK